VKRKREEKYEDYLIYHIIIISSHPNRYDMVAIKKGKKKAVVSLTSSKPPKWWPKIR